MNTSKLTIAQLRKIAADQGVRIQTTNQMTLPRQRQAILDALRSAGISIDNSAAVRRVL